MDDYKKAYLWWGGCNTPIPGGTFLGWDEYKDAYLGWGGCNAPCKNHLSRVCYVSFVLNIVGEVIS